MFGKTIAVSFAIALLTSGCAAQSGTTQIAEQDLNRIETAASRAEEAAKRAEVAAEKAEVIFHKSLQK